MQDRSLTRRRWLALGLSATLTACQTRPLPAPSGSVPIVTPPVDNLPPIVKSPPRPPRIGLALGGGASTRRALPTEETRMLTPDGRTDADLVR